MPDELAREVDPRRSPDPERVGPVLQRPALGMGDGVVVGQRAEVVEEDVVGDLQRALEVDDAVGGLARVVSLLAVDLEQPGVVVGLSTSQLPLSSAATAVIGLNVEPSGPSLWIARLISGSPPRG